MEYKEIFQNMTFERLMEDMLSRIPNSIDKREGSIIWDALAPCAIEFENIYNELDFILRNSFGITADREYLILRALERDVHIEEATQSIVKCRFNIDLPLGFRLNYEDLNFTVFEFIEYRNDFYYFKARCENSGTVGNVPNVSLTPIDQVLGLSVAEVVDVIIPGEDEEDTEVFRQRYLDSIKRLDYGGNIEDYKRKVRAIPGVYGVKVYPIWNGGGTVRIVIQNTELKIPSDDMIRDVQEKIDPVRNQGKGIGIAPIGHVVTVEGVRNKIVNISITLTLEGGISYSNISNEIKAKIENYLLSLSKIWDRKENLIVRVSQIEARILEIEEILDVVVNINGKNENFNLTSDEIPILGVINND